MPGPNNFIVMAESIAGGIRRAVPSILAIAVGSALLLAAAKGLLAFHFMQRIVPLIGVAGCLLVAAMAGRLWMKPAEPDMLGIHSKRPIALVPFQWVNPNSWVLAVVVATAASSAGYPDWVPIALLAALSAAASLLWAMVGQSLAPLAANPKHGRWLNRAVAVAMFVAALQMFISQIGEI
ncbi:MAG: LysE family transporter [Sphingomonas sp.]|nr:LysE family transporter [Sphingomonas sp.]